MQTFIIRNMVCPRCIEAVQRIFHDLGASDARITLGKAELPSPVSGDFRRQLETALKAGGFELLDDPKARIVSEIKKLVIERVRQLDGPEKEPFSRYLSDKLARDFNSLSRLFSTVEGITLERYILRVKTEYVKELLIYDELNLSEIAFRLDYSSPAHLSAQFKKETGMTPTAFRNLKDPSRTPLDAL